MTIQLILLVVLSLALGTAIAALVWEWRWRGAAARPPLPGSRPFGRLAARVDASIGMYLVRGLRSRLARRPAAGGDEGAHAAPDATDDDRPRPLRPTRLVVSGAAVRVPAASVEPARAHPDPKARLRRDLVAVGGLGVAVVLAFALLPRTSGPEQAILGATGTPDPSPTTSALTAPSAEPSSGETLEASPSPSPSPSIEPASSGSPTASPSPSPSPTPRPSATPRPTRTPRPTPSPSASPSPVASPSPTPGPSPSPSPAPSLSPSPEPSASPEASPSPPPSPSEEPSHGPPASPGPP